MGLCFQPSFWLSGAEPGLVEVLEGRGVNQRVWERTEIVERTDALTGQAVQEERVSRVIEVGDFLCYWDDRQGWVPSDPRWLPGQDSFASSGVGYRVVSSGVTGGSVLYYPAGDNVEVELALAGLYITQGGNTELLRNVVPGIKGQISPTDPTTVIYPSALGQGLDLELVLTASGIHQNVIFREKPTLPAGYTVEKPIPAPPEEFVDDSVRYLLLTEINLDAVGGGAGRGVVAGGEAVVIGASGRLCEEVEDHIFFTRPGDEGEENVWSFGPSTVFLGSQNGRQIAVATKSFERSSETGRTYLREALPAWILEEISPEELPVVWDFQTKENNINANTTWRGGETYWVKNVTVTYATLTIEPGATIKREGGTTFAISTYATLKAIGEPHAMITFTGADDTYCGELITGGTGNPSYLLDIQWGSYTGSQLQYCKFRGGNYAAINLAMFLTNPIRDNVFLVDSSVSSRKGIYMSSNVFSSGLAFRNNLFVSPAGQGMPVALEARSPGVAYFSFEFSNNTFVDFSEGIRTNNFYAITVRENIFYNVTTPINGQGYFQTTVLGNAYRPNRDVRDSLPVDLTGSPFTSCALGDYFLDSTPGSEGNKCRFTGARTATAALLEDAKYTVNLPVLYTSERTLASLTIDKTPLYSTPDTQNVCLGFHAPRVDTLIGNTSDTTVTLTVTGSCTMNPGGALGFGPGSAVALTEDTSSLSSVGAPFGEGWNTVLNKKAAGTIRDLRIQSPPRINGDGSIYFDSNASPPAVQVQYTRFLFCGSALANYNNPGFTLLAQDSRFEYCTHGMYAGNGASVEARNCLFRDCCSGILTWDPQPAGATASLCTFDRNTYGIYVGPSCSGTVTDCLFSGNYSVTQGQPLACYRYRGIYGDSGSTITESYCAFYDLYKNKSQGNPELDLPLHERSFVVATANSPYDRDHPDESAWSIRCRRVQNPAGSEILLEDAGSTDAQGATYQLGMRSATLKTGLRAFKDMGAVDIGYHAPVKDADLDGLADEWETFYGVSSPGNDEDADGATNLTEYNQGSRPKLRGGETGQTLDTDGDAWIKAGLWYGRDDMAEGNPDKGDGIQNFGFVSGPVGYDPRRPPYLQNMVVSGDPATCAVTIYWGHDLKSHADEQSWDANGNPSDKLWVRKSTDTVFTGYTPENAPDPIDPALAEWRIKFRRFRLTGLDPDTLYFYRIEFKRSGGAASTYTPIYAFRTWPASPSEFQFGVYGDTRNPDADDEYNPAHQAVADGILVDSSFPQLKFLVCVGDLVFDGGDDKDWDLHFIYPAAKVLRTLPLVAVAGNHEYNRDNTPPNQIKRFRSFFDCSTENQEIPGNPPTLGVYKPWDFNFKMGDAHLFILDTKNGTPDANSVADLTNGLIGSDRMWELVFFHHPGYAHSADHGFGALSPTRNSLFNRNTTYLDNPALGVTAVFTGHVHLYERALVGVDLAQPLNQIVLGGGGATLHAEGALANPPHYPAEAWASPADRADQVSAYNYCIVTVNTSGVTMLVKTKVGGSFQTRENVQTSRQEF